MAISEAAKTQGRHGLSGRRHGAFTGKATASAEVSDRSFTFERRLSIFGISARPVVFHFDSRSLVFAPEDDG